MNVIGSSDNYKLMRDTAVALGAFDGLHKGHMRLIKTINEYAKQHNMHSLVYTFEVHPASFKGNEIKLITPLNIKKEILQSFGIDILYLQSLSTQFMSMSPDEFVLHILKNRLHSKFVCVGQNYRFGKDAAGDVSTLRTLCLANEIECEIAPVIKEDDTPISSSIIRWAIEEGDMKKAADYLGRPYYIKGIVEKGRMQGRVLGYPTANISPDFDQILPKRGVYATYVTVDEKRYPAITNMGTAPTFSVNKTIVESHILDFNYNIYDAEINVEFVRRIRGEIGFKSINELRMQIAKDKEFARSILR